MLWTGRYPYEAAAAGMLTIVTVILVAYLIGAIPFALLVARAFGIPDIRKVGSGNVGATNVHRTLGWKASAWVFLADTGKGAGAVLLVRHVNQALIPVDVFLALAALAAILGHIYPVYLMFRGGKGVLTALGSLCVLMPVPALICFTVFLLVTIAFRYISLGSICGAIACPVVLAVQQVVFPVRSGQDTDSRPTGFTGASSCPLHDTPQSAAHHYATLFGYVFTYHGGGVTQLLGALAGSDDGDDRFALHCHTLSPFDQETDCRSLAASPSLSRDECQTLNSFYIGATGFEPATS